MGTMPVISDRASPSGERCDSRASKVSARGSSKASYEDELYFERGAGGMKLHKIVPGQRVKGQMKDLGHTMVQSMMRSFPREVWAACEIPHPDMEREKVKAEVHAQPKRKAEQAAETIKSLEATLFASNPVAPGNAMRKPQSIPYAEEKQACSRQLQDERSLMWLAKQSGWSILDVEEVRDIFQRHATDGVMNTSSTSFRSLLGDLYTEADADEVKALLNAITGVRRRSMAVVQSRRGGFGSMDVDAERQEVKFSEFYLALVRWLDHQKSKKVHRRCTLVRYHSGSFQGATGLVAGGVHMAIPESDAVDMTNDPIAEEDKDDDSSSASGSLVSEENSMFEDGLSNCWKGAKAAQTDRKSRKSKDAESDDMNNTITEKDLEPYLELQSDSPDGM